MSSSPSSPPSGPPGADQSAAAVSCENGHGNARCKWEFVSTATPRSSSSPSSLPSGLPGGCVQTVTDMNVLQLNIRIARGRGCFVFPLHRCLFALPGQRDMPLESRSATLCKQAVTERRYSHGKNHSRRNMLSCLPVHLARCCGPTLADAIHAAGLPGRRRRAGVARAASAQDTSQCATCLITPCRPGGDWVRQSAVGLSNVISPTSSLAHLIAMPLLFFIHTESARSPYGLPCRLGGDWVRQCAVGLSGVIFGLIVADNATNHATHRSIFG